MSAYQITGQPTINHCLELQVPKPVLSSSDFDSWVHESWFWSVNLWMLKLETHPIFLVVGLQQELHQELQQEPMIVVMVAMKAKTWVWLWGLFMEKGSRIIRSSVQWHWSWPEGRIRGISVCGMKFIYLRISAVGVRERRKEGQGRKPLLKLSSGVLVRKGYHTTPSL